MHNLYTQDMNLQHLILYTHYDFIWIKHFIQAYTCTVHFVYSIEDVTTLHYVLVLKCKTLIIS